MVLFIEFRENAGGGGGGWKGYSAKRSSGPRVANPEVIIQVRDLVRLVGIVAPFAPRGVSIRGKFVILSPSGVNGHRRPVPGTPSRDTPRENQAKFRDGTVWGL